MCLLLFTLKTTIYAQENNIYHSLQKTRHRLVQTIPAAPPNVWRIREKLRKLNSGKL
jgi:hypothetical protein